MRVQIFQPQSYGVRRCVALHGLCRSRFHSTRWKVRYHVTWCLAKTIATRHQGEMWPLQINGQCSRTVLPLTPPETHKFAVWEPSVYWAKHFVHRIARIWTRLSCHLGCSSADGLPLSTFLLSWQNEESDCQKHGRNYRIAQSLPIHHFYHFFYLRLMLFARWRHYFPKLIQINYGVIFRMKRPRFMPNLAKICLIFPKL